MESRSSKRQPEQQPDPITAVATNIGGNVSAETLKQHCDAIESAEGGLKRAQQKLKTMMRSRCCSRTETCGGGHEKRARHRR